MPDGLASPAVTPVQTVQEAICCALFACEVGTTPQRSAAPSQLP